MVLPGVELTLAMDFLPSKVLIKELLPTLERPEKATCGIGSLGNWESLPALMRSDTKFVLIFIQLPQMRAEIDDFFCIIVISHVF